MVLMKNAKHVFIIVFVEKNKIKNALLNFKVLEYVGVCTYAKKSQ